MLRNGKKFIAILLLSCFVANTLMVKDCLAFDKSEVFSAAISYQSTVLYCSSMTFLAMKLVKNVFASRMNISIPRNETAKTTNKTNEKRKSVNDYQALLTKTAESNKNFITTEKVGNAVNYTAVLKQKELTISIFNLVFWQNIAPLVVQTKIFMLARGAIDGSYSIMTGNIYTRLVV